ncbi:nucleotidyl transferase AbiEii/AbiGii toxin family protein [bacterium]|nr:nucleotidyl transferase AbiEii/AbiGii toxin family protein [bacterium]
MTFADVIRRVVEKLEAAGIPYMLTGSFASAFHGASRSTQDIDLVIAPTPQQLRRFAENLSRAEFHLDVEDAIEAQQHQSQFNAVDRLTGWKVDFIIRRSRPFSRTEFDRRRSEYTHGLQVSIASVEDVILSKLEWAKLGQSQRQLEDVAGLLRIRWAELDRDYLDRWVGELGLSGEWEAASRMAGVVA